MRIDREWKKKNSYDFAIEQKIGCNLTFITLEKVDCNPSKQWIDEYSRHKRKTRIQY